MSAKLTFPFSAVYGMDTVKDALVCALINPRIRSILIRGTSGVGKTLIARSLGEICGKRIVNVPLNVTDEQLFGCLDIEEAISTGRLVLEEGLMQRAHGNILYMDDFDHFERRISRSVADSVMEGKVRVEREGMSLEFECDTLLIATVNITNAHLDAAIRDCFDICVDAVFPEELEGRKEVLRRNIAFDEDPAAYLASTDRESDSLRERIENARRILPSVKADDAILDAVVAVTSAFGIDGHRADITMMKAAKANAALDGRTEATKDDIRAVASLVLSHRMRRRPFEEQSFDYEELDRCLQSI